jgi:hypothetical protein
MTQHYHNIWHFYLLKIQVAYQSTILPDANGTSDADLARTEIIYLGVVAWCRTGLSVEGISKLDFLFIHQTGGYVA